MNSDFNNSFCASPDMLDSYLKSFHLGDSKRVTKVVETDVCGVFVRKYINEFWTAKQRKASSLHEISYRACFKPQLPHFFISLLTKKGDVVYDPFGGRGTVIVEAALCERYGISNDVNPLSEIFARPRLSPPSMTDIEKRLDEIEFDKAKKSDIDLSMFYQEDTLSEIVSLREYLDMKRLMDFEDNIDRWIRMTASSRLTGHSKGFFSVYTLPPNQAVSPKRQTAINKKLNQVPEYRDVKNLILKKSKSLLRDVSSDIRENLLSVCDKCRFLNDDAADTSEIEDCSVQLTVTSPPFLDVVQYSSDNWLRCWFNLIDAGEMDEKITMAGNVRDWAGVMGNVFKELYRVTKKGGWVVFEVGEVKGGSVNLDEAVIPLGINAGFSLFGVVINEQSFTKTANIWGISNNKSGTNTNRMVVFRKD